ncbi:MAG: SDR family oxidoreductase [Candidatus Eremiobacteraeota bacterium]|nr:SDR family oxidoreductase [Candidatus Eremiobacteraeota bacterium]
MAIRFDDRVAIVTGAGGGLGRAYALELARRGAKVVVNDFGGSVRGEDGSSEAANRVVNEITAAGGHAQANGDSVSDADGVARLVAETMDRFGRVDVLVNNAGILRDKTFAKMTMEDVRAVLDVHLLGSFLTTKAVWPIMQERGYGRIVMTSSGSGLFGNFGQANYAAAKLGVVGLMNTLELEGAKFDIRCNTIAPAAGTRMTDGLMPPEMFEAFDPKYVVPGVIFLAAEGAPTGVVLCAAAGVFATARIVQTGGVALDTATLDADAVAAHWPAITEETQSIDYDSVGRQSLYFYEKATSR